MKKTENREKQKGFTLIEILATIFIVCLVLGITGNYVMNVIHNSEDKSAVLALNNIKKTASTYVNEFPDDVVWNKISNDQSITYSCVSVNSLVNKGYISKKDINQKGVSEYIVVTKNATQSITTEKFDEQNNNSICNQNKTTTKVTIPTAKKYCNDLIYLKKEQTLTTTPTNNSFSFIDNVKTNAGNYYVKAKLKEGYVWKDDTTEEKTITCSIKKATPELEIEKISNNNLESNLGESGTILDDTLLSIKSNVAGTISLKTSNSEVATAILTNGNNINENSSLPITIKKLATKKANTYITITLTPNDQTNYEQTSIVYTIGEIKTTTVTPPKCKTLQYNNTYQELVNNNSSYLRYNYHQKEVGKYQVTIKLKYGYQWNNNSFKDINLTCEIKAPQVTVTYNTNGGTSCNPTTKTVTYLQKYGALCQTRKTGNTFLGWFTAKTNGNSVNKDTTVSNYQNHTLYANWQRNTYQLSLDANGGTNGNYTTPINIIYQNQYSLDNYIPTRTGYTFKGWYTAASGGTRITGINTWDDASNKTFYAQWDANICTINFNPNGGTFTNHATETDKIQTVKYGDDVGDGQCGIRNANGGWYAATKTGYQPEQKAEWTLGSKTFDQGENYSATDFCSNLGTQNQTVTVNVNWKIKQYSLIYMDNGGKGCRTKTLKYNENYGELCTSQREGYKLIGWFTEKEGGSKVDAETKMEAKDTEIYAHWEVNTHTVTIAINNSSYGTVDKTTLTVPHGTTYSASRNTLNFSNEQKVTASPTSLTGYTTTFSSWSQTSGTITGNTTITTNFSRSANTYSITYNANGGTNAPSSQSFTYNSGARISTQKPTRTGYTFQNWTYRGNIFNPGDAVPQNWGNFTLTAQWRINVCTINFNPNGGTFTNHANDTVQTIDYGKTLGNSKKGMRNANGGYYSATKKEYDHPLNENEWKRVGSNVTFNEKESYKATYICPNLASGDQNVTLEVNWSTKWYLCRVGRTALNAKADWNDRTYYSCKTDGVDEDCNFINKNATHNVNGFEITGVVDTNYYTTVITSSDNNVIPNVKKFLNKDSVTVYIWKGCLVKTAASTEKQDCASSCKG